MMLKIIASAMLSACRDLWPLAAVLRWALAPAREETPMTAENDFLGIVDKVIIEIEDIKGQFPGIIAEQKKDLRRGLRILNFGYSPKKRKKNSRILWMPEVSN